VAFFEAVAGCFLKYAVFSGRASRAEYWNFVLFLVLAMIAVSALDYVVFGGQVTQTIDGFTVETSGPLGALFMLSVLCPLLAVGSRRMHDSGRSGLHLFYPLIAMLGISMFFAFMTGFAPLLSGELRQVFGGLGALLAMIALFVLAVSPMIVVWWLTRPSQRGDNRYGPPPVRRVG
jgi:uncharacterized membrane protein YhaH (DUF805 family)